MNSLCDIRIFLCLVPKESHCICSPTRYTKCFNEWVYFVTYVSSTCFRPHRSIFRTVFYKVYVQIWYVVIRVLLDTYTLQDDTRSLHYQDTDGSTLYIRNVVDQQLWEQTGALKVLSGCKKLPLMLSPYVSPAQVVRVANMTICWKGVSFIDVSISVNQELMHLLIVRNYGIICLTRHTLSWIKFW